MVYVWINIVDDPVLEQTVRTVVTGRGWSCDHHPAPAQVSAPAGDQFRSPARLVVSNQNESPSDWPVLYLQRDPDGKTAPPELDAHRGTKPSLVLRYATTAQLLNRLQTALDFIEFGVSIEQDMSLFYQAVTWLSHDGIICVDHAGIVTVFNQKASEVLGVSVADAVGKPLVSFNPTAGLPRVLQQREVELEDVISVNGRKVAANRAPITIDGQVIGAVSTFQDVTQLQQYEQTVRRRLHATGFEAKFTLDDIIAVSDVSRHVVAVAKQCVRVDATVLITGESGTGKEMLAQGIHNASLRARGPFVAVNCAALPESLLESELFGYDEGAFTGANRGGKQGLFEMAHGGTIFLDEVGELPMPFQSRLLRVLQEREVLRVGGKAMIPVDVRVIAATHQPLRDRVQQGLFRSDLFYRLFVLPLHVPPLRERREDIIPLVKVLFTELCRKYNKSNIQLPPELLAKFLQYDWPGNVRELRNVIERCVILTPEHSEVDASAVLDVIEQIPLHRTAVAPFPATVSAVTDEAVMEMFHSTGSVTECAKALGIHRTTVWRRLKRMGIPR